MAADLTNINNAIPVINNFGLKAAQLLDARSAVDTIETRDHLLDQGYVAEGQITYVEEDKSLYIVKTVDGVLAWVKVTDADSLSGVQADISDLNSMVEALSGAFQYKGTFDELPATDSYAAGNVVIVDHKEYVLIDESGAKSWVEFGDEGNHLTKTTADGYYVPKERTITIGSETKSLEADASFPITVSSPVLSWGETATIGTIGGKDLIVTMPANPDTDTTYTAGTGLSLSGTEFSVNTGYTTSEDDRNYQVKADASGNLYANVPWTDTDTVYIYTITGSIEASSASNSSFTGTEGKTEASPDTFNIENWTMTYSESDSMLTLSRSYKTVPTIGHTHAFTPAGAVSTTTTTTTTSSLALSGSLVATSMLSETFSENTWEAIKYGVESGWAYGKWNVGDTKTTTYNGQTYTIRIADVKYGSTDETFLTEGRYDTVDGGKTHYVFEFVELVGTAAMNSSQKTYEGTTAWAAGGWAYSDLHRALYDGTWYENLEDGIKNALNEITLTEYAPPGTTADIITTTSTNRLFLPAHLEVASGGTTSVPELNNEYANTAQEIWSYYSDAGAYNVTSTKRTKYLLGNTSATWWWLRTPIFGTSYRFRIVYSTGSASNNSNASSSNGVALCFAI